MIFKRAVAGLRSQNWLAITIQLAIVIIGVFIGIQVANWNEERLERRETQRMLTRLKPELRNLLDLYASARTYYATTREYAATAFAGWQSDPKVSDRDFVIAAYQASQIYATAINNATWATIFGADRLRTIDDSLIRNNLAFLMYSDTTQIDTEAVNTPYRQNVRRVIPVEIQDAIRAECGDRRPADNLQLWFLPKSCDLDVPPAAAAMAAAALRAHPQLVDDLRWHTAAAAAFLNNIDTFEKKTRQLQEQIDSLE
jgi:hypothetical protein